MNIKKTTKYSLLAIGVLTTFQLGHVKASADSFENSNESLTKNQDENQPALNTPVSIPESETRAVTEPNSEEKPAVDQGDKKYPAPALTEKETTGLIVQKRRKFQLLLLLHFPIQVQMKLKRLQLQFLKFVVEELQLAIQKYTMMRITVNM